MNGELAKFPFSNELGGSQTHRKHWITVSELSKVAERLAHIVIFYIGPLFLASKIQGKMGWTHLGEMAVRNHRIPASTATHHLEESTVTHLVRSCQQNEMDSYSR